MILDSSAPAIRSNHPVKVIETEDYILEILNLLTTEGLDSTVVMASKRFVASELCAGLRARIPDGNFYTDIDYTPSFTACHEAIERIQTLNPNVIIGIGGGSALDMAKIIRMGLYKQSSKIETLMEPCSKITHKTKLIAIPTTHGSGSEMTQWASIWNKKEKKKYSLSEPENYPDYAIFDVNLLHSLPTEMAITTSLDALSHAFEALWNRNATERSDTFAYKAIELISKNLSALTRFPVSKDARKNLQSGAYNAAVAFSTTKTAAAHSISYPFTAHFGIPHGLACSMSLQSLLTMNETAIPQKITILKDRLGLTDIAKFWNSLRETIELKVAYRLRDYKVTRSDLEWLSELCFTKDRMGNNIINLDKDDVRKILEDIY